MSAGTFDDSFKKHEWLRFLKSQPPEYRVACLRAVLRCDGKRVLIGVLEGLGWMQSLDLITEVETETKP